MIPGANTTTFSGPRGSAFGGTSAATIAEVSPRPPSPLYCPGNSSNELFPVVRSTRNIFDIRFPRRFARAPTRERLNGSAAGHRPRKTVYDGHLDRLDPEEEFPTRSA